MQTNSPNGQAEIEAGARLILSVLSSVPHGSISPLRWWERAKSALMTAAERTYDWPAMVSAICDSLGVGTLRKNAARSISSLGEEWAETDAFERLRSRCERDAVYIVALARMSRDEQKRRRERTGTDGEAGERWSEDEYDRALEAWDEPIDEEAF